VEIEYETTHGFTVSGAVDSPDIGLKILIVEK